MEHTKVEHENPKIDTPPDDTDHTQATPPPPKNRYEIMKDPVFLSFTNLPSFNTFKNFALHES